ncbi:MAG: rRNA maturation RNase YbeY [Spirochaetae bacterium HGW-Spirochaetae-1]|jgi:probable rRNA maturation factor|nr:MAG: rRNA maturation RNase YbeY [Spirochaetae bacterium HGW-Spirochaetae-1]
MARRRIEIFTENIELPYGKVTARFLKKILSTSSDILGLDKVAISLIVTDDAYIREINRAYRKKNKPTDVISFAYREDPFPAVNTAMEELGDIYISAERAMEQATEFGVTLKDELTRLIIHGLLHLVGYDHERSKKDEKIMERKEEEMFKAVSSS